MQSQRGDRPNLMKSCAAWNYVTDIIRCARDNQTEELRAAWQIRNSTCNLVGTNSIAVYASGMASWQCISFSVSRCLLLSHNCNFSWQVSQTTGFEVELVNGTCSEAAMALLCGRVALYEAFSLKTQINATARIYDYDKWMETNLNQTIADNSITCIN